MMISSFPNTAVASPLTNNNQPQVQFGLFGRKKKDEGDTVKIQKVPRKWAKRTFGALFALTTLTGIGYKAMPNLKTTEVPMRLEQHEQIQDSITNLEYLNELRLDQLRTGNSLISSSELARQMREDYYDVIQKILLTSYSDQLIPESTSTPDANQAAIQRVFRLANERSIAEADSEQEKNALLARQTAVDSVLLRAAELGKLDDAHWLFNEFNNTVVAQSGMFEDTTLATGFQNRINEVLDEIEHTADQRNQLGTGFVALATLAVASGGLSLFKKTPKPPKAGTEETSSEV